MNDLNAVQLIGRLVKDADLSYVGNETPLLKFSMAVNKSKKVDGKYIDTGHFFNVVMWGKLGESLSKYMLKGKRLAITGSLDQSRWEKDGQKRSAVQVIADSIQLLDSNKKTDDFDDDLPE
jgi:single-strand DNA-binding protein